MALPPQRHRPGVRGGVHTSRRRSKSSRLLRARRRARRRHPEGRGAGAVPGHRRPAVGGDLVVPGGRAHRPGALHARHGDARGARRRGGAHGHRGLRPGAGRRRREARHDRRRHRRGPGRPGRRSLDADPHRQPRDCRCPSSRPRATASTWRGPRTSPKWRCTWATPGRCSRRSAIACASGSSLELAGWDMRIRRNRVQRLRVAGERVMGIPADGPVEQVWRGPRPVTPDGLPGGGARAAARARHRRERPLHAGPVAGAGDRQARGRARRRPAAVARPGAALADAVLLRARAGPGPSAGAPHNARRAGPAHACRPRAFR